MAWCKGHKKAGGRKKGTPNRTTVNVKAALVASFDELGGVDALVRFGRKHPADFYKLWAKLLPMEFRASVDVARRVNMFIVEEIVDAPPNRDARHEHNGQQLSERGEEPC